ncbi:hypothetical protein PGT21_032165 [Puccinia graminis f. sp. tritici]|uniref:Uncharacterized protein n=1 Tax=Puccinia graminis f. sp. tritici TaxID=56615 RepID=A0A5B0NC22_PUCGR|nr:hypothetical protein PGT21_032165 [Puccinia graminis f. sp. tritici]KAA1086336.1 hypothetical protein PGTUg99_014059 [Puccinia graminis f. sp. tritici]
MFFGVACHYTDTILLHESNTIIFVDYIKLCFKYLIIDVILDYWDTGFSNICSFRTVGVLLCFFKLSNMFPKKNV